MRLIGTEKQHKAFTLAELLIALAILGAIATFAIPKVLQAQQDSSFKAIAKEAVGTVSQAFAMYKLQNQVTANTHLEVIKPYLNYVTRDTSSSIDNKYNNTGSFGCGDWAPCYRLHNGAILTFYGGGGGAGPTDANYFGGTAANYYVYFSVDPDGKLTSPSDPVGPGKEISFILYTNGKVRLLSQCIAGDLTYQDGVQQSWCPGDPSVDPPWFSWN